VKTTAPSSAAYKMLCLNKFAKGKIELQFLDPAPFPVFGQKSKFGDQGVV
jgi:hypothetical protein